MELSALANLFKILGGIVAILNLVGIIFLFVANRMAFTKIMTNDLKHLDNKLDFHSQEINKIENRLIPLGEDVAYLKGQFDCLVPAKTTRRKTRRVTKKKKPKKKVKK